MHDPGSQRGVDGMDSKEILNTSHRGCCCAMYLFLRNTGLCSKKRSDFLLSSGLSLPVWGRTHDFLRPRQGSLQSRSHPALLPPHRALRCHHPLLSGPGRLTGYSITCKHTEANTGLPPVQKSALGCSQMHPCPPFLLIPSHSTEALRQLHIPPHHARERVNCLCGIFPTLRRSPGL